MLLYEGECRQVGGGGGRKEIASISVHMYEDECRQTCEGTKWKTKPDPEQHAHKIKHLPGNTTHNKHAHERKTRIRTITYYTYTHKSTHERSHSNTHKHT